MATFHLAPVVNQGILGQSYNEAADVAINPQSEQVQHCSEHISVMSVREKPVIM